MKHIQHTEHLTFQKISKNYKANYEIDIPEGWKIDKSCKRNGWNKERSFKRDMWSSQND